MVWSAIRVRPGFYPGRDVVGIEIPNDKRQTIWALICMVQRTFKSPKGFDNVLGRRGTPYVSDLANAASFGGGTTGSESL